METNEKKQGPVGLEIKRADGTRLFRVELGELDGTVVLGMYAPCSQDVPALHGTYNFAQAEALGHALVKLARAAKRAAHLSEPTGKVVA